MHVRVPVHVPMLSLRRSGEEARATIIRPTRALRPDRAAALTRGAAVVAWAGRGVWARELRVLCARGEPCRGAPLRHGALLASSAHPCAPLRSPRYRERLAGALAGPRCCEYFFNGPYFILYVPVTHVGHAEAGALSIVVSPSAVPV